MRLVQATHRALPRAAREKRWWCGWAGRALGASVLLVGAAWVGLRFVPLPAALTNPPVATPELTDRHGRSLRQVREQERFSKPVALATVPPKVVQALLAAEDKRFFSHGGVDWLALARASVNGALGRGPRSGASTITQQLVKISQPRPRTLRTKCIEAVLALRLEQCWTKQQILEAYLNRLDFGHLNVGFAAAADYYFGKPLGDLTMAEAAYLAGLPKNPTRLNPHRYGGAAAKRQGTVLRRMAASGWLAPAELERALAEPLRLRPARRVFQAPHFVELVLPLWRASAQRAPVLQTTLDLEVQQRAEAIVKERLAALRAQQVRNAAVVVIENATGDVLAMAGSENYFAPGAGMVNGAFARRSPGSALKPFTYLLAMERGATPATVVADVPTVFRAADGLYRPENFNRQCYGPMRLRPALANSLNIPAVKVLGLAGGPAALRDLLTSWGLTTLEQPAEHYGLGLTIGNAEVRLLELANAYAALARLGEYRPYRLAEALASPQPRLEAHRAKASVAWLIADILSDNEARALAFGRNSALRFPFPVACKTGTSTDFRDNVAVGYTPEFTVAVWAGNFDGSPMREVSGVTGAAPIMHDVMEHLHKRYGTTWYARPAEIVERKVHPITGHVVASTRGDGVTEKFVRGKLAVQETPADYDANGRPVLGEEYREWLASAENSLGARATAAETALRLLAPAPGSVFVIDPDLPTSARIPLKVDGAKGLVSWTSETLMCREADGQAFACAQPGRHWVVVTDAAGQRAETWVVVKGL